MSINLSSEEIITSALQLPLSQREQVIEAIQESLIDHSLDHGPEESHASVQAGWSEEISRRIADFDAGRTKSVPADIAERMIRGDAKPRI